MATRKNPGVILPPPAAGPPGSGDPGAVNPAALTVEQLARILGVPATIVHRHLAAGAPASADGRVNLVHYAAWLNKELARDDGD